MIRAWFPSFRRLSIGLRTADDLKVSWVKSTVGGAGKEIGWVKPTVGRVEGVDGGFHPP